MLRHLEVRREHRRGQEVSRRLHHNFRQAFVAGEFYDFPCLPKTVPDFSKLIATTRARPPDKYKVLEDVLDWATNIGYPGYANAAIDEIYRTWVLNVMFAKAASGAAAPGGRAQGGRRRLQADLGEVDRRGLILIPRPGAEAARSVRAASVDRGTSRTP